MYFSLTPTEERTDAAEKMNKHNWLRHNSGVGLWAAGRRRAEEKYINEKKKWKLRELEACVPGRNWSDVMWKRSQEDMMRKVEIRFCDPAGGVFRMTRWHTNADMCAHTLTHTHTHTHTHISDSTPCCHSLDFIPLEDEALIFVCHTLTYVPLLFRHTHT